MQEKKFFVNIDLQSNEVVKLKADTLDITSNPASGNTKRIVYYNGQYYYSNGTNWVSLSGGGGGSVTDVTATAPLSSTGGTSPDISIDQADTTTDGYLSSTDWNTFNNKQAALGYTPENAANKSTTTADSGSSVKFPVWSAVVSYVTGLGYLLASTASSTYQTLSNLVTSFGATPSDTKYPSEKLVKDSLDAKQNSLGYTAENVANKSDSYTVSSSTTYASTKALVDGINSTYIPRIQTVTSAATVTPTSANDEVTITAQAVALTLANPSGTPSEGQAMTIRIKDNGTSQTINYGSQYRALGVALPTNTTVSKTLYLGLIYNSTDAKWDVVGVSLEGSDPYTGSDWIDYSATSTIVGWSSFTTKRIRYRVIGKQIFVSYNLSGTSNSTSANFSLPFPILNNTELATPLVVNNGGYALVIADLSGGCFISSNTFGVRWAGSSAGWTASGTKQITGQFFYEIA